jgi:hypothetical protein
MVRKLRTNIDIEDWLWERARKYAVQRRLSMAYVVNLAIRDFLGLKRALEPKRPGRPRRPKVKTP